MDDAIVYLETGVSINKVRKYRVCVRSKNMPEWLVRFNLLLYFV